jgi:hypothetical protein
MVFGFKTSSGARGQKPLAVPGGLLVILPAESVLVSALIYFQLFGHQSREPAFAAGEEDMLAQPLNK